MPKYLPTTASGPTWVLRLRYTGPSRRDLMMRAPGLSLTMPSQKKAGAWVVFSKRSTCSSAYFTSGHRDLQQQAGAVGRETAGLAALRAAVGHERERRDAPG